MKLNKSLIAVAVIALAACSTKAQVFNTVTGPFTGTGGSPQFGHIFSVGATPLSVTSLGFVTSSGGSLNAGTSVQVAIYNYTGTPDAGTIGSLVTSAIISSSSAVANNFAWENATATLSSGLNYAILANGLILGGEDRIGNTQGSPDFSVGTPYTSYSGFDLISPGFLSGQTWKAVNFAFTPVPEPETYAMVAGLGLGAFGLWRRRQ